MFSMEWVSWSPCSACFASRFNQTELQQPSTTDVTGVILFTHLSTVALEFITD